MEQHRDPADTQPAHAPPGLPQTGRPDYEPPQVVTYRGQEVLEELGPAQACSFNHSVVICP